MENDPNILNEERNIFRCVKDIQKLKRDAQKLNEQASAYEFGFEKTSKLLVPAVVTKKHHRRHLNIKDSSVHKKKKASLKDQFIETDNSSTRKRPSLSKERVRCPFRPTVESTPFEPSNEPVPSSSKNIIEPARFGPSNEPITDVLSNEPEVDNAGSTKLILNDLQNEAVFNAITTDELISSDSPYTFISQENVQRNVYDSNVEHSMDFITFELDETQEEDQQLIETLPEGIEECTESGSILFRKSLGFFEIIESKDKQITAKCLSCESSNKKGKITFKGIRGVSSNFLKHLKVKVLFVLMHIPHFNLISIVAVTSRSF